MGLELAGEITARWPDETVTIVDPAGDILSGDSVTGGFPGRVPRGAAPPARHAGVDVVLGTALREEPPSEPGEAKTFTVTTRSGREITAGIWFRCFGVAPVTGYLARTTCSPVGDLTALPEAKMAGAAAQHADVVAANIRTLINGGDELTTYKPGPPGVSPCRWAPPVARPTHLHVGVLGAAQTVRFKSADLKPGMYAEMFGLERRN